MRATLIFTAVQIKRLFRDKMAMFFTILFPLIFLFIFGTIFGGNDDVTFRVMLINRADSPFASQFVEQLKSEETFKITETQSLDEARQAMSHGEAGSAVELPADFGQLTEQGLPSGELVVYYDEASPQAGQTLATIMGGILDEINITTTGLEPPLRVASRSADTSGLSSFDYTFSGLLAFTLMSLMIFGLSNQLPTEKKTGSLRRIKATPFRPAQLVIGMTLAYLVLTALSAALMIIVGVAAFHFEMRGNWLELGIFAILSALVMAGFGMIVAAWARNQNQSAVVAQAIGFPMMFLSGVFIPTYVMPEWLQNISAYIPLSPVADGVRFIATEGAHLIDIGPQLGLMAIWGVAAYLVAFKLFRWE
jgi:ABC-2 type transport system permease protein